MQYPTAKEILEEHVLVFPVQSRNAFRYADFEARCKHCGFRMVLDTGSRAYDMANYHFLTKCPSGPSQQKSTTKSALKVG